MEMTMDNSQSIEISWQHELLNYIDDDFEKQVLKIAMEERSPEDILRNIKEILREKLYEDQKSEN
jgi:hypothetical protein